MAQTFTAYNSGVAFAATKIMGGILNGHATEILKIRRVGLLNGQTAGVTGVLCNLEMRYMTGSGAWAAPTADAITSHDSTNTAPTTYTHGNGGTTPTGTPTTTRRTNWSSDEAAVTSATSDELECFVPLNILYDWQPHSDIQPYTLRQNQIAYVWNISGAAGLLDTWIEFTKE
jgi:hypothetical protein